MGRSTTDSVRTPTTLLRAIKKEFGSRLYDPTPFVKNFDPKKHKDGLTSEWGPVSFCNPPYSRVAKFIEKSHTEWRKRKTVIMLVKATNLGTKVAKQYAKGAELRIFAEQLKFPGYPGQAHFSSALLIWRAGETILEMVCRLATG